MGEYEPDDSRDVTLSDRQAPGEPPRTGPREEEARAIESALARAIREGHRTADLVGPGQTATSCSAFAQLVAERV